MRADLPSGETPRPQAQPASCQRRTSLPAGTSQTMTSALVVAGDERLAVARQAQAEHPVLVAQKFLRRLLHEDVALRWRRGSFFFFARAFSRAHEVQDDDALLERTLRRAMSQTLTVRSLLAENSVF